MSSANILVSLFFFFFKPAYYLQDISSNISYSIISILPILLWPVLGLSSTIAMNILYNVIIAHM